MGDRGNIVIREADSRLGSHEAVFLYSHWGGTELPETLRKALAKRWRWDDAQYLARIIFDVMTEGVRDKETGHGISTRIEDNEYDLLVLMPHEERIYRVSEERYGELGLEDLESDCNWIDFESYIAVDERTWDSLLAAP